MYWGDKTLGTTEAALRKKLLNVIDAQPRF